VLRVNTSYGVFTSQTHYIVRFQTNATVIFLSGFIQQKQALQASKPPKY
jgi:hypothetical protein